MLKKIASFCYSSLFILLSILSLAVILAIGTFAFIGVVFVLEKTGLMSASSSGSAWYDFLKYALFFVVIYVIGIILEFLIKGILFSFFGEKIYTNKFSYDLMKWLSYILEAIFLLMIIGVLSTTPWFAWLHLTDSAILAIVVIYFIIMRYFDTDYYEDLEARKDN